MISKRDILEIACKVLDLFCLIQAVPYISAVASVIRAGASFFYLFLPFLFYLIAAFILLKWSRGVAFALVREDQPLELGAGRGWQESVYKLSLRIVGAVVIISSVPAIISAVLEILFRSRLNITPIAYWISLASVIIRFALGVYFIGGAEGLVRITMRGSQRESDSDDA